MPCRALFTSAKSFMLSSDTSHATTSCKPVQVTSEWKNCFTSKSDKSFLCVCSAWGWAGTSMHGNLIGGSLGLSFVFSSLLWFHPVSFPQHVLPACARGFYCLLDVLGKLILEETSADVGMTVRTAWNGRATPPLHHIRSDRFSIRGSFKVCVVSGPAPPSTSLEVFMSTPDMYLCSIATSKNTTRHDLTGRRLDCHWWKQCCPLWSQLKRVDHTLASQEPAPVSPFMGLVAISWPTAGPSQHREFHHEVRRQLRPCTGSPLCLGQLKQPLPHKPGRSSKCQIARCTIYILFI